MVEGIASIYRPRFAFTLALMLKKYHYRPGKYLAWFWSTNNFTKAVPGPLPPLDRSTHLLTWVIGYGIALQIIFTLILAVWSLNGNHLAWFQLAIALGLCAPIIWAHIILIPIALAKFIWAVLHPKSFGKAYICWRLERQVIKLRRLNDFQIVAVVGSVGKTSAKLAIAKTLEAGLRVRFQEGNYNDRLTVPLVIFGHQQPGIFNLFAWSKIISVNQSSLKKPFNYDVVVVELGTDSYGQIEKFAYLKPEVAVITAVEYEHMAFFENLDEVAEEELAVARFSNKILVCTDNVSKKYLYKFSYGSFGINKQADVSADNIKPAKAGQQSFEINMPSGKLKVNTKLQGSQGVKALLAAAAVAEDLGLNKTQIGRGMKKVEPFAGRMNPLKGLKGSIILDDTYNASPKAVEAALDVLYSAKSKQRIAILGSMNELGKFERSTHKDVGQYCNPKKLNLVVTIGRAARDYLAPAAAKNGCQVEMFMNPHEAGEYVKKQLKEGAVVLAKGSQNGVFAEEAVKPLLANKKDAGKLVRQSAYWLSIKRKQFHGNYGIIR